MHTDLTTSLTPAALGTSLTPPAPRGVAGGFNGEVPSKPALR